MIIAALFLSVLAQDTADNPEFKGWTPYKAGSSISYKFIREGSDTPGVQKTTLKSIDDKEAVIETEFTMAGKSAGKPTERKITAKIPAAQVPQDMKEGEDEIEVAGKKLKCKTREFAKKLSTGKSITTKAWLHEEIPGGVAKAETVIEGAPKITMIASEWEKK